MSYLKCKDCRYETFKIDDPYADQAQARRFAQLAYELSLED